MKLYYVEGRYFGLKRDAERYARECAKDSVGDDIEVRDADVRVDKANVLRMLNDGSGTTIFGAVVYRTRAKGNPRS